MQPDALADSEGIGEQGPEAADVITKQATQHEIVVEELGGDVPAIEISALQGTNIDDLLEMISLVAEVEELTANPKASAIGTVIEAQLEVGSSRPPALAIGLPGGEIEVVLRQLADVEHSDLLLSDRVTGRGRRVTRECEYRSSGRDSRTSEVRALGPVVPSMLARSADAAAAGAAHPSGAEKHHEVLRLGPAAGPRSG